MRKPSRIVDHAPVIRAAQQDRREIAGGFVLAALARVRATFRQKLPMVRIFAPFAAGYFLSYLFRTINGPLADNLKREFGLDERQLGLLTAAFF